MQELIVIDDILSALTGIEGRYISIKKVDSDESYSFHVAGSMDLALQARIFTYMKNTHTHMSLCILHTLVYS